MPHLNTDPLRIIPQSLATSPICQQLPIVFPPPPPLALSPLSGSVRTKNVTEELEALQGPPMEFWRVMPRRSQSFFSFSFSFSFFFFLFFFFSFSHFFFALFFASTAAFAFFAFKSCWGCGRDRVVKPHATVGFVERDGNKPGRYARLQPRNVENETLNPL